LIENGNSLFDILACPSNFILYRKMVANVDATNLEARMTVGESSR
jgi:hypothetical protein